MLIFNIILPRQRVEETLKDYLLGGVFLLNLMYNKLKILSALPIVSKGTNVNISKQIFQNINQIIHKKTRSVSMTKFKRILAIILIASMLIPMVPIGEIRALAAGGDLIFTGVVVNKVYRDLFGAEGYSILITGENFRFENENRVEVGIMGDDGKVKPFNPTYSTNTMIQYELKPDEISGDLYIDGKPIDISEDKMPSITNKTPTTGLVDGSTNSKITLTGSGFDILKSTESSIKGYLFQGNTNLEFGLPASDTSIESELLAGKTGNWNVKFEEKKKISNLNNADLSISHRYIGMFSMINKLDVSEKIDLIPSQGPVESTAFLQADELKPTDQMSVFFLKNLDDPYLAAHMGTNENYRRDEKLNKDIFSFTVPKALKIGSYYVVLTNNIDPKKDIKSQIKSYKVLDSQFIVIDRKSSVIIDSIDPSKGSAKGVDAEIKGQNIARLSPNIYEGGNRESIDIDTNTNKMIVKYEGGKYKAIGEDGVVVKDLKREIRFLVGGEVKFREGSRLDETVFDYINVRVGENLDREKLTHDVIVEISTTINYIEDGISKETEIFETHTLKNGFTYEALDYQPEIRSIVPYRIPVDSNYEAIEGLKISIVGEKFSLYRYTDDAGKIQYKYPKFDFGGQFTLDPNKEDVEMKILNNQGKEIDGTEGNDLGTKILLTIPAGKSINKDILYSSLDFKLTNPIRVPESEDEGSSAIYKIQFIKPESNKIPNITSVDPSTVTTDGQNGVKIKGSNFDRGVKLYLDGEEIRGVKRNGTGTELEFNAPARPEGIYQIIVQNENGELAIYDDFNYTKTYTDIKIRDFNPKRGGANTLVTVKGESFVEPNPLVSNLQGVGVYKLIGTRVLLGGKDVNEYHKNGDQISLQDYTAPENNKIMRIEENRLKLSDYYHSIILEDAGEEGKYYTIHFNPFSGKIELSDGYRETYIIEKKADEILATKDGAEFDLTINNASIKVGEKTLNFRTPYKVEGGEITGNKVKVIDSGELIFTVPPMAREGFYDLTLINPDTKRDSKTGNNGFYYFFQPEFNPKIEEINPNEGSVDGDYYINIKGSGFVDNGGENKTSVIIGETVVAAEDIEVSIDGKNLKVKVPKYPGNLADETDMDRKTVAVVVVNPDGGSDSVEDGFSYIIPISNPRITNLILNKGSASGGETVIIEGSGFRYFEPFRDLNNNTIRDEDEPYTELNGNDSWDDLRYWISPDHKAKYDELAKDYHRLVKPILPKVYFGVEEVEIVDFTASSIEVKTPKGEKGDAEVYLVNNDYGRSNKLIFKYESSDPNITSITPPTGKKQGGEKVEILGREFHQSNIKVIEGPTTIREELLQIIQFGDTKDTNMSNEYISIDAPQNSGRIRDRLSTVKVGSLTVNYDAREDQRKLSFSLVEEGVEYRLEGVNYDDGQVFLPVNLLKNSQGQSYVGNEYVRVMLEKVSGANTTSRLRVDRGFSPQVRNLNSGQLIVDTPSYYTIGIVPVRVINPDGEFASTDFEYKNPESKAEIENIQRDGCNPIKDNGDLILKVNYQAGSEITIIGQGFRAGATVRISDLVTMENLLPRRNQETSKDEIKFKMPSLSAEDVGKRLPVFVINSDGGTASTLDIEPQIFIEITKGESSPQVTSIEPDKGSARGGTKVTIKGSDFRANKEDNGENQGNEACREGKFSLYFGDQVVTDFISIKHDLIEVIAPASNKAGQVEVRVVNPDGEASVNRPTFTYISTPKINDINPKKLFSNDEETVVTLTGEQFQAGAKVIVGGKIIPTKDVKEDMMLQGTGINGVDEDRKNIELSVVGGNQTATAVVEGNTIKVTFTESVDLENTSVIVINPDGGISEPYKGFKYELPLPLKPMVLEGIAGYEKTVMLMWNKSDPDILNKANSYEIYGRKSSEKENTFIANTEGHEYLVRGLEENTKYTFMVRALNEYGAAIDFATIEVTTLSAKEDYKQKEKEDKLKEDQKQLVSKGRETITDKKLEKVLGSDDLVKGQAVLDYSLAKYKDIDEYTIKIPLAMARTDSSLIVRDGTLDLNINPKDLYTEEVIKLDKGDKDANLIVHIKKARETNIPRAMKVASQSYEIDFKFQASKETIDIGKLLRSGSISLNLDTAKYGSIKNAQLYSFNKPTGLYTRASESYTALIDEDGKYVLLYRR